MPADTMEKQVDHWECDDAFECGDIKIGDILRNERGRFLVIDRTWKGGMTGRIHHGFALKRLPS